MFNFSKPLDLPPQLQWKYANEPELMTWTIRARNYNTFVANAMFWFCFIAITVGSIFLYRDTKEYLVFNTISTLLFFIIVNTALISMTHQRMNFAYRFTRQELNTVSGKTFQNGH
jgi:membrane protein YdbS with pleckstrin-like domain